MRVLKEIEAIERSENQVSEIKRRSSIDGLLDQAKEAYETGATARAVEIYGEILQASFDEKSRFNPSNPYSSSKAAAEMIVNGYIHSYKIPVIIIRANNIFGTRQHPEKLISGCCWSFLKKKKFPIHGSGNQKRSFLYIRDFCEGIYTIINKGKINEIYKFISR